MSAHDEQMIVQKINRILLLNKDNQSIKLTDGNGHYETVLLKTERLLLAGMLLTDHIAAGDALAAVFHKRLLALYDAVLAYVLMREKPLRRRVIAALRRQSMLTDLLFVRGYVSEQNTRVFKAAIRELYTLLHVSPTSHGADGLGALDRLFPHLAFRHGDASASAATPAESAVAQAQALQNTPATPADAKGASPSASASEQSAPTGASDAETVSSPAEPAEKHQPDVGESVAMRQTQPASACGGEMGIAAAAETTADTGAAEMVRRPTRPKKVSLKARAKSANRRILILNILAQKTVATIKEIAAEIPDVSPKTLQRELQKLVADGIIEKQGEKRWTQYRLL